MPKRLKLRPDMNEVASVRRDCAHKQHRLSSFYGCKNFQFGVTYFGFPTARLESSTHN